MRPATSRELRDWDELVAGNPDGGQILQTRAWGEFKRRWGWHPSYWLADTAAGTVAILFLRRRFPGLGELWYAPKGPGVTTCAQLVECLTDRHRMSGAFLVKVEPEIREPTCDAPTLRAAGLRRALADVQVHRSTMVVDLGRDEDALLASFKPKTRYNIRLAARRGVTVEAAPMTEANASVMYSLLATTQARAGFFLRREQYFTQYWQLQEASGQGQLFLARLGGEILAGVFATWLGRRGWYKDGGSTKAHSELMAPHLLQWEVMRFLRGRGVEAYDLVAVPPRHEVTPAHPLYGLYRFKSGFADEIIDYIGTWDLPLRPAAYALWERAGDRLVQRWVRWARHDLLY